MYKRQVFTPKGDVIDLPSGSTVIDFAYAIHSAVGNSMIGAKVDGRIVPIDYQVKTGQIVEIATTKSQAHGPNRDWLQIVKTSEARNKIRAWFKKEKKEENIARGKAEIERDFKRDGIIPVSYTHLDVYKRQSSGSDESISAGIRRRSFERKKDGCVANAFEQLFGKRSDSSCCIGSPFSLGDSGSFRKI